MLSSPMSAGDLRDNMVIIGRGNREAQIVEHVKVITECKMRIMYLDSWERGKHMDYVDFGPVRNDTTIRCTRQAGPIPAEVLSRIPHMRLF